MRTTTYPAYESITLLTYVICLTKSSWASYYWLILTTEFPLGHRFPSHSNGLLLSFAEGCKNRTRHSVFFCYTECWDFKKRKETKRKEDWAKEGNPGGVYRGKLCLVQAQDAMHAQVWCAKMCLEQKSTAIRLLMCKRLVYGLPSNNGQTLQMKGLPSPGGGEIEHVKSSESEKDWSEIESFNTRPVPAKKMLI